MTQFSSGKHEKLTADPQAWLNHATRVRYRTPSSRPWPWREAFRPRPEFERPLTNPANRLLGYARESGWRAQHEYMRGRPDEHMKAWTPDEVLHARAVLTRLAILGGES